MASTRPHSSLLPSDSPWISVTTLHGPHCTFVLTLQWPCCHKKGAFVKRTWDCRVLTSWHHSWSTAHGFLLTFPSLRNVRMVAHCTCSFVCRLVDIHQQAFAAGLLADQLSTVKAEKWSKLVSTWQRHSQRKIGDVRVPSDGTFRK